MPEHVAYIRQRKLWKWIFYRLLTFPTLRCATAVHCTSEEEAVGAKELLGPDCKCVIVGNGVDLHHIPVLASPSVSNLTFCYVGRISPEKGVNEFIRAWLSCRKPQERLIVVGGGEGKYFSDFLALFQAARSGIDYRGFVPRDGVLGALEESHFLILPSGLGRVGVRENFGIAVAEALGAGRPVMVTRGLSWDHLEQESAGMVFDRTEEAVKAAIERARVSTTVDWARMATAARAYAERELDIQILAERLMTVLRG
jgi:glycosyltransferase involved in cell wall biosynthesis